MNPKITLALKIALAIIALIFVLGFFSPAIAYCFFFLLPVGMMELAKMIGEKTMTFFEGIDSKILLAFFGTVYIIHFFLLHRPAMSMRNARRLGWSLGLLMGLVLLVILCSPKFSLLGPASAKHYFGYRLYSISAYFGLAFIIIWVCALAAYSIPCTFLSSLPLLFLYVVIPFMLFHRPFYIMAYLLLFFAYLPLAGYLFPKYRQLSTFWRPAPLPRLRPMKPKSGMTLIELLIVVAIIAILSAGIAKVTGATQQAIVRQQDWRCAVGLIEDEFALLRARSELPPPGLHPVEPELAAANPLAKLAEVEIRPGPSERLREARVTVRLESNAQARVVTMRALLPVRPAAPAPAEATPKETAR